MNFYERESNSSRIEFARKKKPSGRKNENRVGKLPNHIRHDQNAAISVGVWKKRKNRERKNY